MAHALPDALHKIRELASQNAVIAVSRTYADSPAFDIARQLERMQRIARRCECCG